MWIIIFMIAGALLTIGTSGWRTERATGILNRWAEEKGYTLTAVEHRYFRRGPLFWGGKRVVYHVAVQDVAGNTRTAFVRLGPMFPFVISEVPDVRWEQ